MGNKLFRSGLLLLILLSVFLGFGNTNITFAKKFELTDQDVETIFDAVKTLGNIVLPEGQFKSALNTTVKGVDIGADITYGLLVLSAANEMEFIDMVVSQRYRGEADKFFRSVLNKHLNLFSYYKGVGFDLPRVLSNRITSPIAALTLNTFALTNKAFSVLITFNVLKEEQIYDGLWRYFDSRRNSSSHQEAWRDAEYEMLGFSKFADENYFAALWNKWGQHTTAFGVTQEAKQRFNEEMRGLVAQAIEANTLAEKVSIPSPLGNIQSAIANLAESVKRLSMEAAGALADKAYALIKAITASVKGVISRGGAGFISISSGKDESQLNQVQDVLDVKEDQVKLEESKTKPGLVELVEIVENEASPVGKLTKSSFPQIQQEVAEVQLKLNSIKEEVNLNLVKEEILGPAKDTVWCTIDSSRGPVLSTVVFSEIAWMGGTNSANDEWMKLKNISNSEVSIAGWQVQDADNQIQISFSKEHRISPQDIFILERTNDDSLPGTKAHLIYTGALNNTNEALYLFDEKCVLRDKVVASPDWLAGDSASRKPMARDNDFSWYTQGGGGSSLNAGSIPIAGNPSTTYPKILISEVQTVGLDSQTEEFMELYNPTNERVDLTDWYIQKKTQGADDFSTFVSKNILSGKTIQAQGYFLIAREGSSFAPIADAMTSYSLGDNNTLAIKNPNGEIVDKIGWGDVQDADNTPALNPPAGKSLNRIWSTVHQTYYDRDNNSIDFAVHNLTSPKAMNHEDRPSSPTSSSSPSPPPQDTTPPEVTFGTLSSSQNNTSFSLSWTTSDPQGNATPSGIQSIFVEYTVTPSATGVFVQYNNNGVWTNWQAGSTGKITLSAQTTSLSIRAQDGVSYTFQVSASDVAGNISIVASASTAVTLPKTVVVNEIAWMGTTASANDEWIEFYNATDTTIDLAGWRLVADDGMPTIEFPQGKSITANGYFLLERTGDTAISNISADLIYTGDLGNGGEILRLYDAQNNLIDLVDASASWLSGDNTTKQSMERVSASQVGSSASNWAKNNIIQHNGKDAGTTIVYGTPGNWINGTPRQANSTVTSPTTISDTGLRFDEFSTITLTLLGSPYITTTGIISITIPAGKTLIVEPGVTVKFADNRGRLTVQGTLKAQGTQENQITFTVDTGAVWCGVNLASTSTGSQLEYVTIDKAVSITGSYCTASFKYSMYVDSSIVTMRNSVIQNGNTYRTLYLKNSNSTIDAVTVSGANLNPDSVALYIDGGSPTISNSTISNNSIGIFVNSLSNNPTIQNNTFTGNTYPLKLDSAGVLLSGNAATNNTYNGILVEGTVSSMTWQADAIPYIVNKFTVSAGTTLTIQAGVVVKFINTPYTDSGITVQGTLVTQGTLANPVVFTAVSDNTVGGSNTFSGIGATSWKWIYLAPGSTGSQLTYTILTYGGNTYYKAALYVKQSDVQLSNVTISNSAYSAIYSSLGTISGSGVTLINNTYGFHIELGDCPTLTNTNVTANVGPTIHPSSFPSPPCSF